MTKHLIYPQLLKHHPMVNPAVAADIAKNAKVVVSHDTDMTYMQPTTYGTNGFFSVEGIDNVVVNAHCANKGMLSFLPVRTTTEEMPVAGFLTGFTDETGDEQDGPCDPAPVAGVPKSCLQIWPLGRVMRETKTIEMDKTPMRKNRGVFDDLILLNPPTVGPDFGTPPTATSGMRDLLRNEVTKAWVAAGVTMERVLARVLWTGNPTNNSANEGYKEFYGFESLVKTGYQDAFTDDYCTAIDSYLFDMNYLEIGSEVIGHLFWMWRYVNDVAERANLMPVQWVWSMRPTLFAMLCDIWPCIYATWRCSNPDTGGLDPVGSFDTFRAREMSNEMRNGSYLLIDGVQIPVIVDDGIPEMNSTTDDELEPGEFSSDIYLIPMAARGFGLTYLEHVPYDEIARIFSGTDALLTSDGGRFLWVPAQTKTCINWAVKIEPRLRLMTPHVAGRLQNIMYNPIRHFRDVFPDGYYFVNGGVYDRTPREQL